jgi:hypothetical protein
MRNSPACNCCDTTCEVIDTTGDASVCDGTWPYSATDPLGPRYEPTGTDGTLLFDLGPTTSTWYAAVHAVGKGGSDPRELSVRLIAGAADCENYYFLEVHQSRNAFGSLTGQVRLGKVEEGFETILCKHFGTETAGSCPPVTLLTSTDTGDDLSLCWDGTTLLGIAGGVALAYHATPFGTLAGLGFKDRSGVTTVRFTSFVLQKGYAAGRPDCEQCALHCCDGPVPEELVLEIDGIDAEAIVSSALSSVGSGCKFPCEELIGTYYLTRVGVIQTEATGGDAICIWKFLTILEITAVNCDNPADYTIAKVRLGILVTVTFDGTTHLISVVITGSRGGIVNDYQRPYAEVEIPCVDWTDWIDLTPAVEPYLQHYCSMDGYAPVLRIKKS